MNNRELLVDWYEEAFDGFGEALQDYVSNFWYDKYKDSAWEEFHDLDKKLKVKFYYEDEIDEQ